MNRLETRCAIVALLLGLCLPPVPTFAAAGTKAIVRVPRGPSVTRADLTLRVIAGRHRDSTLLAPGSTFEEVTLQVTNARRQPYTVYATDFLLLNAAAQVYFESAADTALAHQIVVTRIVPPGRTITATVAFVVSVRDHLVALQWAYHRTDPGVAGSDPAAEQMLALLPGVVHPPVPTGPLGAITLHHVTVQVRLHTPIHPAGTTQRLWIASISLSNQSTQPVYYGAGSFALLDGRGLFHVPVALDSLLQPLPAGGWLPPGHAITGRIAARFPAGITPVAVRWTSLQFAATHADWIIRLPGTLLPVPAPTPAPSPTARAHVYTVLDVVQALAQTPWTVLGRTIRVRGVALWSAQMGLMLVDTRLLASAPRGLSPEQAVGWVAATSSMMSPVQILFLRSPQASTYGKDLIPRVYRVELHPQSCHTANACPQGTLLGS